MAIAFSVLISSLVGCWPAGKLEPDLMLKYQQYALANSPQKRADKYQDLLLPVPGTTGIPIKASTGSDGQLYVQLSLQEAVHRAILNNVEIKVISYDPAIAREKWIEASAAFDTVVFSDVDFTHNDQPPSSRLVSFPQSDTLNFDVGLKQPLITGGTVALTYELERMNEPANLFPTFNPQFGQSLGVKLTQPLLQNGGLTVNLANVRVAKLNYKTSLSQFTSKVLDIISQVQTQYWQLVQARRDLEIQQELLDETIETYNQVKDRFELDASAVQITQALAAVESRRALLIQARKNILDVQDQLIRTINDSSITLVGDSMILPTTPVSEIRLQLDRADQVATALKFNPELEQARLAISISSLTVDVAQHQTLPKLDLTAGTDAAGVNKSFNSSFDKLVDFNGVDYNVGLSYQYPLGNRAAEAVLARSRYENLKNITNLQNVADQVAVAVNTAVRQIETSYDEMQAQKAAVEANEANLEAINNRQRYREALTPEFLQLKLQSQENLAVAQSALNAAQANFNIAQANLDRVVGTSIESSGVNISEVNDNIAQIMAEHVRMPALPAPVTHPASGPASNSSSGSAPVAPKVNPQPLD